MKEKMISIFLVLAAIGFAGCGGKPTKDVSPLDLESQKKSAQLNELRAAEDELDQMHFEAAAKMFREFRQKNLNSPYFYQSALGEAKALEGMGKWTEAAHLYQEIVEATRQFDLKLAALALYRSSFDWEALGDETKVYASLTDAENLKQHLPPEISKAELPVRLAASLHRMGRSKESAEKLRAADIGLAELKQTRAQETSKEWLARTYFQMGLLSTNQLSLETYQASLDTLKIVQIFSLRAVEAGDPKWSNLAAETLSTTYRDLANLVDQVPINRSLEKGMAIREQREAKSKMAGQLLETMENLKTLRLTTENEQESVTRLYSALFPIEKKLSDVLLTNPIQNELTAEAQKLNSLKKNVKLLPPPLPVDNGTDRK